MISRILVDPATAGSRTSTVVLAASTNGLLRSTDSGRSWTEVLSGTATDLVARPGDPARLHAAVHRKGVFQSGWRGVLERGLARLRRRIHRSDQSGRGSLVPRCAVRRGLQRRRGRHGGRSAAVPERRRRRKLATARRDGCELSLAVLVRPDSGRASERPRQSESGHHLHVPVGGRRPDVPHAASARHPRGPALPGLRHAERQRRPVPGQRWRRLSFHGRRHQLHVALDESGDHAVLRGHRSASRRSRGGARWDPGSGHAALVVGHGDLGEGPRGRWRPHGLRRRGPRDLVRRDAMDCRSGLHRSQEKRLARDHGDR